MKRTLTLALFLAMAACGRAPATSQTLASGNQPVPCAPTLATELCEGINYVTVALRGAPYLGGIGLSADFRKVAIHVQALDQREAQEKVSAAARDVAALARRRDGRVVVTADHRAYYRADNGRYAEIVIEVFGRVVPYPTGTVGN